MEVVREAVVGEIIVVEEAWNSIIVAVGPNTSQSTASPVAQLLTLAQQIIYKLSTSSPSTKLLAVLHVGLVGGVTDRKTSQTSQEESLNSKYELQGAALDVCRQIVSQAAWITEPCTIIVTKDAVNDDPDCFESLTLVQSSTFLTNDGELATFSVSDNDVGVISRSGSVDGARTSPTQTQSLADVDC